jgi:hypothetical protein
MRSHLLFFLLASSHLLSSQPLDFKIQWGEEFKAPRKSSLDDIVGHDATGIYAIKVRGGMFAWNAYTLERYDKNFRPVRSVDLELKEDGQPARIQHVLHLKNKLLMFYVVRNRTTNMSELYVREINKNTLMPEADRVKLGEADEGRVERGITFNFRTSRDSSKVGVSFVFPNEVRDKSNYGFIVLDDRLQLLWKKFATLPYSTELFTVESFKVDNSGNAYLLGISYKEKRRSKRKGKPNYSYEVLAWTNKGEEMKSYPISLEDRFLTDMQIEVIDNKNLICAGFYSAKGTFSVKGTYFLTVDLGSKGIKTKSFKEFGLDFIIENMSEREANRAVKRSERGEEVELYEYDLDKLLVGKDGSAILIGEQYFVEEVTTSNFINGRVTYTTTYHYYYNDIIAVKIDPKGQIQWAEKISKTQHTVDDGGFFSSYTLAILNGRICFFFNDHPSNVSYKGAGRPMPYRAKESIVILASLNQKGEQTRQPVFALRDVEVIMRPKVCEQVSNYDVILFGQRKKTQQFARVVVE